MKLYNVVAVAIVMSSGVAFAQESTSGGSGATDPGKYLTGPTVNPLYTDEKRTAVRPAPEFKAAWDKMNDADRADIKQACEANRDVSFNPLCTNVGAM